MKSKTLYLIVAEIDGKDRVLVRNLSLFQAEQLLCRYLDLGYEAYIMEKGE